MVEELLLLSRFSRIRLCGTPQTAAHQAPLSMGFSRQEHWSGVPLVQEHESEYENHTVTWEHSLRIILVNGKSLDFRTTN